LFLKEFELSPANNKDISSFPTALEELPMNSTSNVLLSFLPSLEAAALCDARFFLSVLEAALATRPNE